MSSLRFEALVTGSYPANPIDGSLASDADGMLRVYVGKKWVHLNGYRVNKGVAILYDIGNATFTSTAAAWNIRRLNSFVDPSNIIQNSSTLYTGPTGTTTDFVLGAGTYFIEGYAACSGTGASKLRLRNITDNVTAVVGSSHSLQSGQTTNLPCLIYGIFTIAGTKTFQLQHYTALASPLRETIGGGQGVTQYTAANGPYSIPIATSTSQHAVSLKITKL